MKRIFVYVKEQKFGHLASRLRFIGYKFEFYQIILRWIVMNKHRKTTTFVRNTKHQDNLSSTVPTWHQCEIARDITKLRLNWDISKQIKMESANWGKSSVSLKELSAVFQEKEECSWQGERCKMLTE